MKRIFTFFSILIMLQTVALPQSNRSSRKNAADNKKKAEEIMVNSDYYCGESGNCKDVRKADDKAMKSLLKNISNDKSLQPIYFVDSDDENEQHERLLETFMVVLKDKSENIVLEDAPGTSQCFRYIKKSDFAKVCKQRENKILEYIRKAISAEQQLNIGESLRYYYWALMLCHSHPDGENLEYFDPDNEYETSMYRWVLERTEKLLSEIKIMPRKPKNANGNEFVCGVYVNGEEVNGVEFSYNNGSGTVAATVDNGLCCVKLEHSDIDNIDVFIDLENINAAKFFDPEVHSIMRELNEQIDFPSAKKVVDVKKLKPEKIVVEEIRKDNIIITDEIRKADAFLETVSTQEEDYTKIMKTIEKAIYQRKPEMVRDMFTDNGFTMFRAMLDSGNGRIIGTPKYKFLDFNNIVICRSIPMQFDFGSKVSFLRQVAFRIEKDTKKVESIAFMLNNITESQILSKDKWLDEAKLTLIDFLEDYQTAYALKRREYLNNIFSDDALIIVGSVLNKTRKSDNVKMKEEVRVKYDTLSKGDFIMRLNKTFDNNEFVSLNFSETTFNTVNNINNVIGVEVKQEYLSSTYGDVGYLFLMVDLRGDLPVIHVRTWQPKETPVDDKINANAFRFE